MAKPISYLGIDLSPDSIKIVELAKEQGKPKLVTYGYTESKSDILKGDFIANKNLTATMLKEVADRAKVTTNFALAALPTSAVFSSVVKLANIEKQDLQDRYKIKSLLATEVKKILPRSLEQMTFDFNLIPADYIEKSGPKTKLEIVKFLITAADNNLINQYKKIFEQANFQLKNLDIESFALIRSLIGNEHSLIMLVDIGENRTNLCIVNLTIPILSRSIQAGGANITKAIADSLNISISEAENYKLDMDIMIKQTQRQTFPKPVEEALAPILTEIKYLLNTYYEQTSHEKTLDKVILTGGTAILGNLLDKYISQQLNIRVYVGDPWARIVYPQELEPALQEIGPRFSVAIGLAMRELV